MQKQVFISLSVDELKALIREVRDEPQPVKAEPAKQPDFLMDTRSVCQYLGVSAPTLRRFVREGHLPAVRIQSALRYKRSDVEKSLTNVRYLKHARKPF